MSKSLIRRIEKFNEGRDTDLLKLKYEALKESPFRFFRGTCHLYYEDLPEKSFILKSAKTWICGDLHLENFGTFKGNNRLAYFDMNDFDEAMLGPCLLDVVRLCTSIFLAADLVKLEIADCNKLVKDLLESYACNLEQGYIKHIEQKTATGFVKDLLDHASQRKRSEMLKQRVQISKSEISIKHDLLKAFQVKKDTRKEVKEALKLWAQKNTVNPEFYKLMDVANRATGTGSIGIERHLVLVHGKGKPDGYYLLDIKEAALPSGLRYLDLKQPKWKNEAERLIAIQRRVQAASPAYLNPIKIGKKWFVMKELQPLEDKVDFNLLKGNPQKFTQLLNDMGGIIAWNNLRSGGRQNSAIADELIMFGAKLKTKENEIIDYAAKYAAKTIKYWEEFKSEIK